MVDCISVNHTDEDVRQREVVIVTVIVVDGGVRPCGVSRRDIGSARRDSLSRRCTIGIVPVDCSP